MAKRRGAGEGSIYQRSDGRWVGQFVVGRDENGRLQRKTVYGRSQAEVIEKLEELRGRARAGALPERASSITVSDYLTHWLEVKVRPSRARNTHQLYRQMLHQHVFPMLGGVRLQRLSQAQIEALFARLAVEPRRTPEKRTERPPPLSGRTRRILYHALRKALKDAVQSKLLPRSPMEGVPAPRQEERTPRFLEREEAAAFLDAAKGDPYEALFVLAVTAGLRLGELCGLRWRDVDLRRREIRVEQQLDDRTRELSPLKTEHSRRIVPIPNVAIDALLRHRERLGAIPHGDRLVFLSEEGTPLRASNVRRRNFARIIKTAKLESKRLRIHDLRHTMATLLSDEGAPLTAIQRRLGHKTLATTVKVYTHLTDRRAREVADLLDNALGTRPA